MHGHFTLFRRHIAWQTWPEWYWPWHNASEDEHFGSWCHFAGIGPLQFHWHGNKRF